MRGVLRGANYVYRKPRISKGIPQEGDMREDERSKDGKGRFPGVFLDEKTLPSPHTLIKGNSNLLFFPMAQFLWQLLH